MLRGYRLYIAALGLALTAYSPNAYASSEKPQAKNEPTEQTAPAAIQPSGDSAVLTAPCEPTKANRKSDLCAQWKAADAARDAANWAMIGVIIAFFGGMGLFWQIRLTRQTLDSQIAADRPVVVCSDIELRNVHSTKSHPAQLCIDWTITNYGGTPAFVEGIGIVIQAGRELPDHFTQHIEETSFPLQPGGESKTTGKVRHLFNKSEANRALGTERISAVGLIRYHNVAGLRWETRFAMMIEISQNWERVKCYPVPGVSPIDVRLYRNSTANGDSRHYGQ